jgi:hypothetical protein
MERQYVLAATSSNATFWTLHNVVAHEQALNADASASAIMLQVLHLWTGSLSAAMITVSVRDHNAEQTCSLVQCVLLRHLRFVADMAA